MLLFLSFTTGPCYVLISFRYFFNGQVSELNAELSYSWEEVKAYREVVYSTYKGWKIACKIEITLIRRNIFFS